MIRRYDSLNADRALIFRITHLENLTWILENGLYCRSSQEADPEFVNIGNLDLIDKRHTRIVPIPPAGSFSDYIPFYFTPFSPMMYNIHTGYSGIRQRHNREIVILAATLRDIDGQNLSYVFTDRHAYLATAQFFSTLDDLDKIDWTIIQNRDFQRDLDDPEKTERYQAEALIHQHLPVSQLYGIVCFDDDIRANIQRNADDLDLAANIVARPNWYF